MKYQTKNKNILLLSAGRRVSLARAMAIVAKENNAQLITADMHPEQSAACQDSSNFVVLPNVMSPDYPKALEEVCLRHKIKMVVPTIDTELAVLTNLREKMHEIGTEIIVSSPDFVSVCNDKRITANRFAALGLKSPEVFASDAPRYPAIAKPYDGSLSRDVHILRNKDDFVDRIRAIPNLMLAQYLDPAEYEEFTCDAYYDNGEKLRCVVPRLRLEVRGGEVSKARTVHNNIVELFQTKLSHLPGARGCLTFQFFRHRNTGDLYLIEINARFGGGFPLSLAAGADYPAWLYAEWVLGQSVATFSGWEVGLTMLRYDAEVLVRCRPADE